MSPKRRATKNVELIYKLDGDLKEVDVFKLAPALLAVGKTIQEAHRELGVQHEVGVNLKPFGKGSFVVDLVLFVKSNMPLMFVSAAVLNEALENTTQILEAIGFIRSKAESVIGLVRKLHGTVDKVEQLKSGEFRYHHGDNNVTIDGNVHTLMQNPVIHANMVQMFALPAAQENVTGIEMYLKNRRQDTEVKIERDEVKSFEVLAETNVPSAEPIREVVNPPQHYFLKPKRVSLEGEPDNWSFRYGSNLLHVDKISDRQFLEHVRKGDYHLSSNDVIEADVVVVQKIAGSDIISTTTEIVKADYKPSGPNPQGNLFLPPEEN